VKIKDLGADPRCSPDFPRECRRRGGPRTRKQTMGTRSERRPWRPPLAQFLGHVKRRWAAGCGQARPAGRRDVCRLWLATLISRRMDRRAERGASVGDLGIELRPLACDVNALPTALWNRYRRALRLIVDFPRCHRLRYNRKVRQPIIYRLLGPARCGALTAVSIARLSNRNSAKVVIRKLAAGEPLQGGLCPRVARCRAGTGGRIGVKSLGDRDAPNRTLGGACRFDI